MGEERARRRRWGRDPKAGSPPGTAELPDEGRGEIIDADISRAGRKGTKAGSNEARFYFGLSENPTPDELAAAAAYYPVFCIEDG